eukprot:gene4772-34530_t
MRLERAQLQGMDVRDGVAHVYQDYSIRASRSLNNDLELVREWMDNSMAPGSARNTPPNGLALKITFDIVERNDRRVLVYTDNGQSVPVQHLDNLLCYGHKDKTCPAIIDPDGTTCRIVLALPNKEPKDVLLADLMYPKEQYLGNEYGAAVATAIGYFTKDQYQSKRHGGVAPLYSNLEELMLRARDVPRPGVLFDVMLMEGPRQGCELGGFIRPVLQDKDVEIYVQKAVVDRFIREPWCRALQQDDVIKTEVLTIPSPSLGDIKIQIVLWPSSTALVGCGRYKHTDTGRALGGPPPMETSHELFHLIYRGIAKRIWEERDRIRESRQPPSTSQVASTPAEIPPGGSAAHAACSKKNPSGRAADAARAACNNANPSGIIAHAVGSNPGPSQEAPVRRNTRGKDIERLALTLASVPVVIPRYSCHDHWSLVYLASVPVVIPRYGLFEHIIQVCVKMEKKEYHATMGSQVARMARTGLSLASVPVVIHRDNRKRKNPEKLTYTVPQKVVPTSRARANRNHRQQAEPNRNAAIKMLERSIAQAQKLKKMLKDMRNVPTPAKKRALGEKNEEVVEVAKSAYALVSRIAQG